MRIDATAKMNLYKKDVELNKQNKKVKETKINGNDKFIDDGKINGNDKIINDGKVIKTDETTETESKLKTPEDKMDISVLKAEADKAYSHLRRIVEDLLKRQGISIERLSDPELKPEDIEVDQKARDEAKQMIEEGGPLSAENVSTRIVDFAKAISNGNLEKFDLLKDAIEEGFNTAKEIFGEEMPEITQETYDLVQEKLEAWKNGTEDVSSKTDTTTEEVAEEVVDVE